MSFAGIPEAIEDFRQGKILVVVDDEDRENEGDLTIAAEKITPEAINFMATRGRGLICLALDAEICARLDLQPMSQVNTARFGTAFCEAIDAAEGVTTGISAYDRAQTIRVAMDPQSRPQDLARPGHVFPLRARPGGVLVRSGQTEAAVDLAKLAGFSPGGVICEIMNEDGTMARVPQLIEFCREYGFKMISVADLIRYRTQTEKLVERDATGRVRTAFGEFETIRYKSQIDGETHLALIHGDIKGKRDVLVRVHSHCVYGDIFNSQDCDCRDLIGSALRAISRADCGVFVYLHQSGPGIQVAHRDGRGELITHGRTPTSFTAAEGHQPLQHDTGVGAQILSDLGLSTIHLLTNHPRKVVGVEGFGIQITKQIAFGAKPSPDMVSASTV
jgi:3,4-dihydroxy 2-butanone 4-phosphate synthase/GTP cyclohydrolase II